MSADDDPRFFSILPDEVIEQILKDATKFPGEFKIPHPDNGNPLFTPFVKDSCIYPSHDEAEWKKSLPTRCSLMLVSKRISRIATPILYSSVFLRRQEQLTLLWKTLQENVHLCLFKRIAIGLPGSQNIVHDRVIVYCTNIIIFESDAPIDLYRLPSSLLSLRVRLSFADSTTTQASIHQLKRFKSLELLELRSSIIPSGPNGDRERLNHPLSCNTSSISLRTVAIAEGVPASWRNDIIHPGAPIRNIVLRANDMGPYFFDNVLPRMPHVTHLLLLSQSKNAVRGRFNPIYTLPRLQHVDIEALWETRGFNAVDLISLERVASFSFGLKWFPLREMVHGLKYLIKHQLAPNLQTVYTTKKYFDDVSRRRSAEDMVKELIELLEGAGVEWLVLCDSNTFSPMRSILEERGA